MTVEWEFRDNGGILRHWGVVSGEDLIEANKELYAHVFSESLRFQLMDLTEVESFDASQEHMKVLAQMDKHAKKAHKQFACVVAPTDFLFAMSRSWNQQSEADDFETNVVRSMPEALAWFAGVGVSVVL